MNRMKNFAGVSVLLLLVSFLTMATAPRDANAVSQFARKYKVACSTCHTVFPRLNYYGERFLMRGYQDPDATEANGDTLGKEELNENLFIDKVGNWFGARLNMDAVRLQKDKLSVDGSKKDKLDFGDPNWFQFFIAGSIFKNLSIFIEAEHEEGEFKFTWFYFTIPTSSTLVNFQLGNLSPLEFASQPNRLRVLAPIKGDVFGVKATGGASAADNLNVSGVRPGAQYYGYAGPLVWWAGIGTGKGEEVNDEKHYWGGVKFVVTEDMDSPFEGSSLTAWYYKGNDTNTGSDLAIDKVKNEYDRVSIQGNVRYEDLDIQVSWVDGSDDNWDLSTPAASVDFDGLSIIAAYLAGQWYPVVAYDKINSDDDSSLEKEFLTLSLSYLVRENFRIGGYARIDMDQDADDYFINLRTMF